MFTKPLSPWRAEEPVVSPTTQKSLWLKNCCWVKVDQTKCYRFQMKQLVWRLTSHPETQPVQEACRFTPRQRCISDVTWTLTRLLSFLFSGFSSRSFSMYASSPALLHFCSSSYLPLIGSPHLVSFTLSSHSGGGRWRRRKNNVKTTGDKEQTKDNQTKSFHLICNYLLLLWHD